jgi:hypothetical protein
VVEGQTNAWEIEHEFNFFWGPGWRCIACPIGLRQFTMILLTPKEVEHVVYYGECMRLRTIDSMVSLA